MIQHESPIPPATQSTAAAYRVGWLLVGLSVIAVLFLTVRYVLDYRALRTTMDLYDFQTESRLDPVFLIATLCAYAGCLVLRRRKWSMVASLACYVFITVTGFFVGEIFFIITFVCCLALLWTIVNPQTLRGVLSMIIPLLVGFALMYTVPFLPREATRAYVARTRSDMRTLATGLEAYYIDHNAYPPSTSDPGLKAEWQSSVNLPTFQRYQPGGPYTLTTPLAYLTSYPIDLCRYLSETRTFAYYVPPGRPTGWILISPGPDCVFDVTSETLPRLYRPAERNPTPELLALTYDPTNGIRSRGDVYRFKE